MSLSLYSPTTNFRYPAALLEFYEESKVLPHDAIEISAEIEAEFFDSTPPAGKHRIAGMDGLPAWGDIPEPTKNELIASAVAKKSALSVYAAGIIAPLKDAFDGGFIDDEDKPKLIEWQKYRYAVTKVDPENPVWPDMPVA